ncbi:16S rRNA (guanine(527)-N(7))-methyltransferase RsmG [Actinophytocola gossypii]|uniref:Ribosomal RNA small subunit methyltransferase G n=1 Tax=Actinophytocola gossypii TaxID=2812003 RepID=A0ABT2JF66_9PSEU|nr:16S rRNA (guanine(527)-N(7))-methyltransferase RsmG [Actinophytocola gossypii]MCT2586523.1 16S rRNA (guanine(527)-N(7))-methyltransferase RsmG [Actinophytocola gossypii]
MDEKAAAPAPPESASSIFGDALPAAVRFAELLAAAGIERGLIGPREVERLWERHLLNSAVVGERVPDRARVVDLGSGAGLPGVPLILARPDLDVTLLEPMARRVAWLEEVVDALGLSATVLRGRAEEPGVKQRLAGADVVIARAVAPLDRLWGWSAPLLRQGGRLVALKGESAADEIERDGAAVGRAGGGHPSVERCGADVLDPPATIIEVERMSALGRASGRGRPRQRSAQRTRKEQGH